MEASNGVMINNIKHAASNETKQHNPKQSTLSGMFFFMNILNKKPIL